MSVSKTEPINEQPSHNERTKTPGNARQFGVTDHFKTQDMQRHGLVSSFASWSIRKCLRCRGLADAA